MRTPPVSASSSEAFCHTGLHWGKKDGMQTRSGGRTTCAACLKKFEAVMARKHPAQKRINPSTLYLHLKAAGAV